MSEDSMTVHVPTRWSIPRLGGPVDIPLLLFLVLLLDVRLPVKFPVLVIACVLQPGFWKAFIRRDPKVPVFYPLILGLALADWILYQSFGNVRYDIVGATALVFWAACWVASTQVRLFTDRLDPATLHRTLLVFFLCNAVVSLADLVCIDWQIKALNPYLYQGMYQKYFIRTGDYVKGLTFDTSITNALINAFGVVYFLARKQGWMMLLCMACMLATGSNFTNYLLLGVFAYLFIFKSDREQKGGMALCMVMGIFFLGKVSPQNQKYTEEVFNRWLPAQKKAPEMDLDSARKMQVWQQWNNVRFSYINPWKPKPLIPTADINTPPFQSRADTSKDQLALIQFKTQHRADLPMADASGLPEDGHRPGKLLAFEEIGRFYKTHPSKILTGDGPGNFSSKLAFRATGLGIYGKYPRNLIYIHPDFLHNHLQLFLSYFAKSKENHSLIHSPDSVYGQLLGEYGIIGLLAFLVGYVAFFVAPQKNIAYSLPLLGILLGAFFVGYWFEQLSIVVLFELMVFVDRKTALWKA